MQDIFLEKFAECKQMFCIKYLFTYSKLAKVCKKLHLWLAWKKNKKSYCSTLNITGTIYHYPLRSNIFRVRQVTHINLEVFTAQLRVALSTHNMSDRAIFNRYQANAQTSYSSPDDLLTAYPTSVTDLWSMSAANELGVFTTFIE